MTHIKPHIRAMLEAISNLRSAKVEPKTLKPIVENVMTCTWCTTFEIKGRVDRFPHHLECRDCGAIGDLVTGIMTRDIKPEKESK